MLGLVPPKKLMQPEPAPEVGNRLRIARDQAGVTQTAIGKLAGIKQEAVSRFESGERGLETPRLIALLRAASELGINVEGYVLRGIGSPLHQDPIVYSQDPAFRGALVHVLREIVEKERQQDGPASEPVIPGDKRGKP